MMQALRNAWNLPDLRRKILFTLFILTIFRLTTHVPVPGVNPQFLAGSFTQNPGAPASGLLNILDLLSGGAVATFSVLAMGVYPYITAQIILQLLVPIIPRLEALSKEGETGRQQINQYTYYLTVPLALLQAVGQIRLFDAEYGQPIIPSFGSDALLTVTVLATMTAGTMFAIWLGELISEQGIGNGLSIIIFGGIVARIPSNIVRLIADPSTAVARLIAFLLITAVTVAVIVFVTEGERRIPVQYGKRVRGRRMTTGGATYIPLKVNQAGMIPLIFAQSILTFPAVIAQFFTGANLPDSVRNPATWIVQNFSGGSSSATYWVLYFFLVVAFTYFYTFVMFEQQNLADNLQRQGGFIPGIRPGKRTEEYINAVTSRITLVGAVFLGAVAILPWPLESLLQANVLVIISAGLLIVVGVVIDTMRQLEAQLLMRHYEGFIQ